MRRIQEANKLDLGLLPQSLASTSATGSYFGLIDFRKICFTVFAAAIAAGKTVVLQLLQATDTAGSDSKNITGATVTLAAHDDAVSASAALASAAITDVVTVNGVDFTMAAATDTDAQEFADAAGLVSCINAYFDDVIASAVTTTVTVTSVNGEADVTLAKTEVAGTITLATVSAIGMVEALAEDLDIDNGFGYVAAKVTTDATIVVGAGCIRSGARHSADNIGEQDYA